MKHVNTDTPKPPPSNEDMLSLDETMLKKTQEIEDAPSPQAIGDVDDLTLKDHVVVALREIYDPEIPVNIYDLGLIYRVDIDKGMAEVDMTLTTPGCPVAHSFPGMVQASIRKVAGIKDAKVNLVWDPAWTQDMLTEEARLQLGLI